MQHVFFLLDYLTQQILEIINQQNKDINLIQLAFNTNTHLTCTTNCSSNPTLIQNIQNKHQNHVYIDLAIFVIYLTQH